MTVAQPEVVAQCVFYTPGLTTGKSYVVQRDDFLPMVKVIDDNGRTEWFWSWRFAPWTHLRPRGADPISVAGARAVDAHVIR